KAREARVEVPRQGWHSQRTEVIKQHPLAKDLDAHSKRKKGVGDDGPGGEVWRRTGDPRVGNIHEDQVHPPASGPAGEVLRYENGAIHKPRPGDSRGHFSVIGAWVGDPWPDTQAGDHDMLGRW